MMMPDNLPPGTRERDLEDDLRVCDLDTEKEARREDRETEKAEERKLWENDLWDT